MQNSHEFMRYLFDKVSQMQSFSSLKGLQIKFPGKKYTAEFLGLLTSKEMPLNPEKNTSHKSQVINWSPSKT